MREDVRDALKISLSEMRLWRDSQECDCTMDGGSHSCGLPRLTGSINIVRTALAAKPSPEYEHAGVEEVARELGVALRRACTDADIACIVSALEAAARREREACFNIACDCGAPATARKIRARSSAGGGE